MTKNIKYKDVRIGSNIYTVKLEMHPHGGMLNGIEIRVEIMEWHQPPRTLRETLRESRYFLNYWYWDPAMTSRSLDDFIIEKCTYEANKQLNQSRGIKEWESI